MEPINVVLVHGAWAEGSSWRKVIPLPQDKGFNVTAGDGSPNGFAQAFASDVDPIQARVMAAVQKPLSVASFTGEGAPAWQNIPSWYMVATKDQMIPPQAGNLWRRVWVPLCATCLPVTRRWFHTRKKSQISSSWPRSQSEKPAKTSHAEIRVPLC